MAEKPMLAVKSERDVYSAFRALDEGDRKRFMQLSTSPIKRSNVLGWAEATFQASRQALSGILNVTQGDGKAMNRMPDLRSITEYPTVLNVFRNNNFDIGDGTQVMFKDICRLNHACVPKAQGNFNTNLGHFTVHAIQSIQPEEEITVSYLAEHGALRDNRQSQLQRQYGFPCGCAACDFTSAGGKAGEQARQNLQSKLHAFAEEASQQVRPDPAAELAIMEEMIQTYESQGIAGREVASMCLAAAELAVQVMRKDVALKLAQKGLRLDEDAVGGDSPMLEESRARVKAMAIV